jgi:colanic acid/amylovoran biosynthesis glycosyltransferase
MNASVKKNTSKTLLVTLADKNYINPAKQLFSSVYFNAGWKGDVMLLAVDIPSKDSKWFSDKGIIVKNCKPLHSEFIGVLGKNPCLTAKFYLLKKDFKKWDNIIFLDADIIVRAPIDNLSKVKGFYAVPDVNDNPLSKQFIGKDLLNMDNLALFKELGEKYDLSRRSLNSGVMAFSTDIIKEDSFDNILKIFKKYYTIHNVGDQPSFNLFFYNSWKTLSPVYNMYGSRLEMLYGDILPNKIRGIILHVFGQGDEKPWSEANPFYKEWKKNFDLADKIDFRKKIKGVQEWTYFDIYSYSFYLGFKKWLLGIPNKKLKIAFVVSYFPKLSETFVTQQITGLINNGYHVDIYAHLPFDQNVSNPDVDNYSLLENVKYYSGLTGYTEDIYKIHKSKMLRWLRIKFFLFKNFFFNKNFAKKNLISPFSFRKNYDAIVCHFGSNGYKALSLKKAGIIAGKVITFFHGIDMSKDYLNKGDTLYDNLYRNSDLFIPTSDLWRDKFLSLGYDSKKIVVQRLSVNLDKFRKVIQSGKKNAINILTTSRLVEKKGLEYSIKAVSKLLVKYPNIKYEIIGGGPLHEELDLLIKKEGSGDNIKLLGERDSYFILKKLQEADLFVLSSVTAGDGDMEGIPVSIMEAMSCEIPVVSTYHSGISELIIDNESGFLVEERNVDSLAEKIEFLISNPKLRIEIGKNGRKKIEEKYSFQKANEDLIKLIFKYRKSPINMSNIFPRFIGLVGRYIKKISPSLYYKLKPNFPDKGASENTKCFCTICTADYIPNVYALRDSLKMFDRKIVLNVLVVDSVQSLPNDDGINFFSFNDIGEMGNVISNKYKDENDNLRWASKPLFLEFLLDVKNYSSVIYVDNDINFFGNYSFLFDLLKNHSVILTPHWRVSTPDVGSFNLNFKDGFFNAGFFGASNKGMKAIRWWRKCCEHAMSKDYSEGLYVDQKYLDLMPIIFENVFVVKHMGCNVANWNVNVCRRVDMGWNRIFINGQWPIIFIHFTKSLKDALERGEDGLIKPHFDLYQERVNKYKKLEMSGYAYSGDILSVPISDELKKTFWGITTLFNPAGYNKRSANYKIFRDNLKKQGLNLLVVELAFGDQQFQLSKVDADILIQLRVDRSGIMWQKERLLNIALKHLPKECTKVAWIDADVVFRDDNWVEKASMLLDKYIVAQPFSYVVRLHNGESWFNKKIELGDGNLGKQIHKSFAYSIVSDPIPDPITGYAWVARREFLNKVGFFDEAIVGGSDRLMAYAFSDTALRDYAKGWIEKGCTGKMLPRFLSWFEKVVKDTGGSVGYLDDFIFHLWHGKQKDRLHGTRELILLENNFNPERDIKKNTDDLWVWSSDKSKLHAEVSDYFTMRNEDGENRGISALFDRIKVHSRKGTILNFIDNKIGVLGLILKKISPRLYYWARDKKPKKDIVRRDTDSKSEGIINVATSTDIIFVRYLPTLLNSISINTKKKVKMYVLTRGIGKKIQDRIRDLKIPRIELIFIEADNFFEGMKFKMPESIDSKSAVDRLFLAKVLPDVKKIIYLDIDLVVNADLSIINDLETSNKGICAKSCFSAGYKTIGDEIKAWGINDRKLEEFLSRKINLSNKSLNSGVMVLDLDKMRANNFDGEIVSLVGEYPYIDQLLINIYANGDFVELDPSWNIFVGQDDFEKKNIIHWIGKNKPWSNKKVFLRDYWNKYYIPFNVLSFKKVKVSSRRIINKTYHKLDNLIGRIGLTIKAISPSFYNSLKKIKK